MRDTIAGAAQLAGQVARLGWYFALARELGRRTRGRDTSPHVVPTRPMPSQGVLLTDIYRLLADDAANVRAGLYPAMPEAADGLATFLARVRDMFADAPDAVTRRASRSTSTAAASPAAADPDLPDYFRQDFHFQAGGYLTDDSARLYDVQVETLFMGAAGPMRRACLASLADCVRGRDQRRLALLDVGCGTGRFLRQVRLTYPALALTGLDLSEPYLDEANRSFRGLRRARWLKGNAERIPLPDASQDVVTSIFLFHELPPEARRNAAAEMSRVLKPGGSLIFLDSIQMGDKPDYDGLIEAFPARFHEPYFRHYAIDDLDGLFVKAGLAAASTRVVFLSKLLVRTKN